jgi:predicted phage terminase large subunit-like protein
MIANSIINSVKKARKTLVDFRHIILTNSADEVRPAYFHNKWSDILLHGTKHYAIEAFRESAKTQYVLRAFPLYALMYPDDAYDYIVIIKNNATLASNKLKEIEREYFENPIISSNCVKVIEQSANAFSVDIMSEDNKIRNVRIEAYGKGASIRGLANGDRRPRVVVADDLQDVEDARSEVILEADWNWFLSDVVFLGKNTRIFLIGNNLGDKCIIERVLNNADQLEQIHFETERIKALTPEGEASWPEYHTKDNLLSEREDYNRLGKLDIWLRERMCESTSEETRLFNESDYVYYSPGLIESICRDSTVFATLDPASSKSDTSCYRAIVVNAVRKDGHWYIVDVLYGRWDSVELINQIFYAVTRYGVRRFGIEKGQLQQTYEPILYREMTLRNIRFIIQPMEHAKVGNKLERIKMLQPMFKSKSIWFPDYADWLPEMKAELAGVTNTEIKSEYIDLVDSLAMNCQMTKFGYVQPLVGTRLYNTRPKLAIV